MKKPIYLKVILASNAPVFIALTGQTIEDANGDTVAVQTNQQVMPRSAKVLEIVEGEIWATDNLALSPKGWYVTGRNVLRITDASGKMEIAGADNKDMHTAYLDEYIQFSRGGASNFGKAKNTRQAKSFMDTLYADPKLAPPTIESDAWYVDPALWWHLVRNYSKKKNTLLIGDSGAGKTDLVQLLMRKIGKPLNIFDMAISNPTKALCGNLRAENGTTHYQYARFANSIQREGACLLDEISRANPIANNILLPVLDKRRTLYIEDAIDDVEIKLHEKCTIWATANIGAKFIGTSQLDHALLNRFGQVPVEYPPFDKESKLLQVVWGLAKSVADSLVTIATTIREHNDLSKDISTRQLMEIAELISDGYPPVEAFKWAVLQQFESDKGDGGERATVMSILGSL